jgi:hypothetical protein
MVFTAGVKLGSGQSCHVDDGVSLDVEYKFSIHENLLMIFASHIFNDFKISESQLFRYSMQYQYIYFLSSKPLVSRWHKKLHPQALNGLPHPCCSLPLFYRSTF